MLYLKFHILIDFEHGKNETTTVFVYRKINKCFIEQPYNEIYRISSDEYNSIKKYIKLNIYINIYNILKNRRYAITYLLVFLIVKIKKYQVF